MSSIEPASLNTSNKVYLKGVGEKTEPKIKNNTIGSVNNKSSEKDDSFCEPVSEQDLEHVQVTDIPEFTIGPGAMNPSVVKVDIESIEKSSNNSP